MSGRQKTSFHLLILLWVAFVVRTLYVFVLTDYPHYLGSDMGDYWHEGLARYEHRPSLAWVLRPPGFSVYLEGIFRLAALFHVFRYKLEIILFLNVLWAIGSVLLVYLIARQINLSPRYALGASAVHACLWPLIYFNAFVLSENVAIPLLILATYLLFRRPHLASAMWWSGIAFGAAVACRPALASMGVSFVVFIAFVNSCSWRSIQRGLMFVLGGCLIPLFLSVENARRSNGQLRSFAPHAGLQFFIAQCKPLLIQSHWEGYHGGQAEVGPPVFAQNPQPGNPAFRTFRTDHAFCDNRYFSELGWECVKQNPWIWLDNLKMIRWLFFGSLFPLVSSVWGYPVLLILSNYLIFGMTWVSAIGGWRLLQHKTPLELAQMRFLMSIPIWIIVTTYFFSVEQRYLYPGLFAIVVLCAAVLTQLKPKPA